MPNVHDGVTWPSVLTMAAEVAGHDRLDPHEVRGRCLEGDVWQVIERFFQLHPELMPEDVLDPADGDLRFRDARAKFEVWRDGQWRPW